MTAIGGLPIVPDVSCPSVASALATSGLSTACKVTSSRGTSAVTSSAVSSITSQLAGFGVDSVLNAIGGWVTDGASWLLTQIGAVITNTTTVDLGASWFVSNYETMMALAGVVIVPMLLLGIMQAVYRQSGSMLIRSVLVNVPLALLLTAVAIKLVSLGLAVTDAMSDAVSHGAGLDAGHFLSSVSLGLSGSGAAQPTVPTFVLFIAGLVVVFGALMVWVELLIRSAAIYVAVLFLPLVLASLAWPAIAHWCRRLVDTLVALILGKFVIVAVLSLAAGALAGGRPERRRPAEAVAERRCRRRRRRRREAVGSPPFWVAPPFSYSPHLLRGRSFASCPSSKPAQSVTSRGSAIAPGRPPPLPSGAWPLWPCGRRRRERSWAQAVARRRVGRLGGRIARFGPSGAVPPRVRGGPEATDRLERDPIPSPPLSKGPG